MYIISLRDYTEKREKSFSYLLTTTPQKMSGTVALIKCKNERRYFRYWHANTEKRLVSPTNHFTLRIPTTKKEMRRKVGCDIFSIMDKKIFNKQTFSHKIMLSNLNRLE